MGRRNSVVFVVVIIVVIIIIMKLDSDDDSGEWLESGSNRSLLESPDDRLFDLPFRYILRPDICSRPKEPLLGILIVTSYVGHDDVRAAHRRGISQSELKALGLSRVFLLAAVPPAEQFITQNSIHSEQRRHGDLLQGDFLESYRNLTYKHVMGLRWAANSCAHARFIVKLDDDSIFDVYRVVEYMRSHEEELATRDFLAGYIFRHQKPIRSQADKHFVAQEEYPGDEFPTYLSGWLYLTNPQTARKLLSEIPKKKFFWIDDTYVTGLLAEDLRLEFRDLNWWFSANPDFFECCLQDLRKFHLECEFVVGPNGGDTQMLSLFQKEARKCHRTTVCRQRTGAAENIRNTCVTEHKDVLRSSHGKAIVRPLQLR